MATYIESRAFCTDCDQSVLARARSVNHVLHLLLTIFLCGGWWVVVWAVLCLFSTPQWRCPRCGGRCRGPGNPNRTLGLILLGITAVVLIAAITFFIVLTTFGLGVRGSGSPASPTLPDDLSPVHKVPAEGERPSIALAPKSVVAQPPENQPPVRIDPRPDAGPPEPPPPAKDEPPGAAKPSGNAPPTISKSAPLPVVTITPPPRGAVLIGKSKYVATVGVKSSEAQAKWIKEGEAKVLTQPVEAELLGRDADFCRVRIGKDEWFVPTFCVPVDSTK